MTTREYYDGVVEDVLAELGFPTDDEEAMDKVMAEIGKRYEDLATSLDEYVCAEARRRIAPIARELMDVREGRVPVPATVDFEAWVHDYAIDTGEGARFDCSSVLDRMELEVVEGIEARTASEETDYIYLAAAADGLVENHDGPFSCRIEDEGALAAYVEARRVREARR